MKKGWEKRDFLNCLQKVKSAKKIPRKQFLDEGAYPIVSQEDAFINGYWDKAADVFEVDKPVVLFGDHTKRIKWVDFDFVVGADGVKILLPVDEINSRFFAYHLESVDLRDLGYARHYRLLKEQEIPIPPLSEQEEIVEVLDKAFAAIDQAKANIEQNIANAKELFQSKLNQIFSQKGEGWVVGKLGDYCDLSRGHNPPKSKFIKEPKDGYVRFWQIRDGWSDAHKVYVPDSPQLHLVEPEDFLMVAYRHIGKVFRGAKGAFNVALCKIKNVRQDVLLDDYLFHMIPSDVIRGELLKRSERSLIPSMSIKHLQIIEIPVPPVDEQKTLIEQLDRLTDETRELESHYQTKLASLDELKKSILQKAFAGELT